MKPFFLLLAMVGLYGVCGCDQLQQSEQPKVEVKPVPTPKCTTEHRFERVDVYPMNMRADIALDSCTGQICRTWSWEVKDGVRSAWSTYQQAPLCKDLTVSNP